MPSKPTNAQLHDALDNQPDPTQVILDNLHRAGAQESDLISTPEEVDFLYVPPDGPNDSGRYVILVPQSYGHAEVGAIVDDWEKIPLEQRTAGAMVLARPEGYVWTDTPPEPPEEDPAAIAPETLTRTASRSRKATKRRTIPRDRK